MIVKTCDRKREEGAALLVAVLMLVLMGLIGLASLDTVTQDRRVAGFQSRARAAFYAADAGVGNAKSLVRTAADRTVTPAFPTKNLGDAATYPNGQPSYQGDPAYANAVRYVKDGPPWAQGGDLRVGKQRLVNTLWQVNVEGNTTDGAMAKIESMVIKLLAAGYGG